MTTAFEIPFQPSTPQQFSVSLNGVSYLVKVRWNVPLNCWVMDMSDQTGLPILFGTPLVTGADLLGQFAYLDIGGKIIVQTDNNPDAVPTFDNLGKLGHAFFVPSS